MLTLRPVEERVWPWAPFDAEDAREIDAAAELDFAAAIARLDRPVVLRNVTSDPRVWQRVGRVLSRWTDPAYIAARVPLHRLEQVKRAPPLGDFMFETEQPMGSVPEVLASYACHFSRHNMSTWAFLQRLGIPAAPGPDDALLEDELRDLAKAAAEDAAEDPVDWPLPVPGSAAAPPYILSYASHLSLWGSLAADIDTRQLVPGGFAAGSRVEQRPYVWAGAKGWVTPCHYDVFHK